MHSPQEHVAKDGFRLRGTTMSRIDAFSDVVFGFAITLIVVSLEVPRTFIELHDLLRGFLPFGITFLMLMLVWHTHYKFFRRFGLHDIGTIWLNSTLLFFVLFYVYPLKFLFASLFQNNVHIQTPQQLRELTLLYTVGFAAVYFLFAALYANAYRQRAALGLDPLELRLTKIYILDEAGNAAIGLLATLVVALLPPHISPMGCFTFMLIAPYVAVLNRRTKIASNTLARTRHVVPSVDM